MRLCHPGFRQCPHHLNHGGFDAYPVLAEVLVHQLEGQYPRLKRSAGLRQCFAYAASRCLTGASRGQAVGVSEDGLRRVNKQAQD